MKLDQEEFTQRASKIKLLILDVDGVMTDGSLFLDNNGEEYKAFNSKDGHGIRMLQECGVEAAILTGRKSKLVKHRSNDLDIKYVMQGYRDKRPAYDDLKQQTGYSDEQIAYIGDDVIDLPVMHQVGLAVAVNDAHQFVREHAHWITDTAGGRGAVRELCEQIIASHGLLDEKLNSYLK